MMKRIVVAGSRDFTDYETAEAFIGECIKEWREKYALVFLSGGCRGADLLGERYANENGFTVEHHPADWKRYGRGAGPKRNREMAECADMVICFWDGESKGTASMIAYAEQYEKEVKICRI